MELRFDPKTRFELSLGDQSLTLTSPEFSALKNFLPGIKLPDETKLIGSLFQAGFLMPETHVVPGGMGAWLKTMPNANLRLIAASKDHWITGIDPAVAWFLDQDFLAMAIGLHESLRSALKRMLYGAAVREQVFPRESGLLALHEIARSWLNAHPEAKKWLEWAPANERFRLHLRALEKVRLASPEAANLRLQLEDKTETRSFPLLQKDFSEIELFLRSRENQFESPIDRFPRKMNDELRAYHLGHAGLLIDFKQTRILIDPLLPAARATFEVEPPSLREIGQIDALFLTHHHSDHCDETLLLGLPRSTRIVIPKERHEIFSPRLREFLEFQGFSNVSTLKHGERIKFASGLVVIALPFFGEASDQVGFGGNTYLFSAGPGQNIFAHADSSPDSQGRSILSSEIFYKTLSELGPIPLIFGTAWQQRDFLFRLNPLTIFQPNVNAETWLNIQESCDCPSDFLLRLMQASGARNFSIYAESSSECFLPREIMSEYIPSVSFLWEPRAKVRDLFKQIGVELNTAEPFACYVLDSRGQLKIDIQNVAPSRKAMARLAK